jgi:ribosomal protein S7
LDEALDALESALSAIASRTNVAPTKVFHRELAPVQQVVARGSISGPGVRGGVDVRGDGSTEAWTGRWVRALVQTRGRESAFRALKRSLGPS